LELQAALRPELKYVAVLADDSATASVMVTVDTKNNRLTIQRLGAYKEADDRSLQLWAIPKTGAPRSLGVLNTEQLARLQNISSQVESAAVLAISLEPKGGVASEVGPTGPVLFKGALLPATL
jgi:anti-sigma-K factor RskA